MQRFALAQKVVDSTGVFQTLHEREEIKVHSYYFRSVCQRHLNFSAEKVQDETLIQVSIMTMWHIYDCCNKGYSQTVENPASTLVYGDRQSKCPLCFVQELHYSMNLLTPNYLTKIRFF